MFTRLQILQIGQSELLSFLDLGARHPGALTDLRVKEPPFDEVYRRLLETSTGAS